MTQYQVNRRHTNLILARNSATRRIILTKPTSEDYRQKGIELSSAPLTGPVGEVKVRQDQREREAIERGELIDRGGGHLPRFDDISR